MAGRFAFSKGAAGSARRVCETISPHRFEPDRLHQRLKAALHQTARFLPDRPDEGSMSADERAISGLDPSFERRMAAALVETIANTSLIDDGSGSTILCLRLAERPRRW